MEKKEKKVVKGDEGAITGSHCSVVPSCADAHRALETIQDQSATS